MYSLVMYDNIYCYIVVIHKLHEKEWIENFYFKRDCRDTDDAIMNRSCKGSNHLNGGMNNAGNFSGSSPIYIFIVVIHIVQGKQ